MGYFDKPVIQERFTRSKARNEEINEDAIFENPFFLAVVDGATSKNSCTFNGKAGGRICAELICSTLASFEGTEDCYTVIKKIQDNIHNYAVQNHFSELGIHLCASAVIYSCHFHQLWYVGDCQFMINGKIFRTEKRIDKTLSEFRSLVIHMLLKEGHTIESLEEYDEGRQTILPFLSRQRELENTKDEWGYPVFNEAEVFDDRIGELSLEEFVSVYQVQPGDEIILASDGYAVLETTLEKCEETLQKMVQNDPLCYKELCSTKGLVSKNESFDDRTFLKFIV